MEEAGQRRVRRPPWLRWRSGKCDFGVMYSFACLGARICSAAITVVWSIRVAGRSIDDKLTELFATVDRALGGTSSDAQAIPSVCLRSPADSCTEGHRDVLRCKGRCDARFHVVTRFAKVVQSLGVMCNKLGVNQCHDFKWIFCFSPFGADWITLRNA